MFKPEEILFSPTSECNLKCVHCTVTRRRGGLSAAKSIEFLRSSKKAGINRVSFTGGEPFLKPEYLYALTESVVKNDMLFGRISTNGVFFKNKKELEKILLKLKTSGYDGDIFVSIDALHRQNADKLVIFIEAVLKIWRRPDMVSIVYINDIKKCETEKVLEVISKKLNAQMKGFGAAGGSIRGEDVFLRVYGIELSPIGSARRLKNPWGKEWFKEDRCNGPGNVFYVMSNGDTAPCCGYASECRQLKIGNIYKDTAEKMMKNAASNPFVRQVFGAGLSDLRKRLEKKGRNFPGKTKNHCYFCWHILENLP